MTNAQTKRTFLRDVFVGLIVAIALLVWFKVSPQFTGEGTPSTDTETSVKLSKLEAKLAKVEILLKQEEAKNLRIEESYKRNEQELNQALSKLIISDKTIESLRQDLEESDTDLKILSANYQMRLEELGHMMNAIKLHKTINYSVINRAEEALNTADK